MDVTIGTACGKVILFGEHAVVHGVPAIGLGIDRGAQAKVRPASDGVNRLRIAQWAIDVTETDDHSLARAFRAVLGEGEQAHAIDVEASSDLPPGAGLGCSAAMGVALVRARHPNASLAEVVERAMAWERIFHGNPSGIDAAIAAQGGGVLFSRGAGATPIRIRGELMLCIANSGIGSSTKSMVEAVAALHRAESSRIGPIFEEIGAIVALGGRALEVGDSHAVGALMDRNHNLLKQLAVSIPELDAMCSIARGRGALGAKLTGAGGGGCVVALAPNHEVASNITEGWRAMGLDAFVTIVSAMSTSAHRASSAVEASL